MARAKAKKAPAKAKKAPTPKATIQELLRNEIDGMHFRVAVLDDEIQTLEEKIESLQVALESLSL